MDNAVVDYRFGEKTYINDFLIPDAYMIKQALKSIPTGDINSIAQFIRDNFQYPFTVKGTPATDGELRRYKKRLAKYLFDKSRNYVVAYPDEVLVSGWGYCLETACLCTSLLLATNQDGWVDIGEVRKLHPDTLMGYHAWSVVRADKNIAIETTIHTRGSNNIIPIASLYDPNSNWAKLANLYYVVQAHFNKTQFIPDKPNGEMALQLIFTPKAYYNPALLLGFSTIMNHPKIHRIWKREHARMLEEVSRGWESAQKE